MKSTFAGIVSIAYLLFLIPLVGNALSMINEPNTILNVVGVALVVMLLTIAGIAVVVLERVFPKWKNTLYVHINSLNSKKND